jgi:hypothetical protein
VFLIVIGRCTMNLATMFSDQNMQLNRTRISIFVRKANGKLTSVRNYFWTLATYFKLILDQPTLPILRGKIGRLVTTGVP